MSIAGTTLSINSSASSYNGGDNNIWDRQNDCSTATTLLSSPLDDDSSVFYLKDKGDRLSPWSTLSERIISDLSDATWNFSPNEFTPPLNTPLQHYHSQSSNTASSVFTDLTKSIDPIILSAVIGLIDSKPINVVTRLLTDHRISHQVIPSITTESKIVTISSLPNSPKITNQPNLNQLKDYPVDCFIASTATESEDIIAESLSDNP